MSIFIVRLQDTNEMVGLFWADNLNDLWDVVDECTDPFDCEYARMKAGGIFWPGDAQSVPTFSPSVDDDAQEWENGWARRFFADASLCDNTLDELWYGKHRGRKMMWHRFKLGHGLPERAVRSAGNTCR